LPYVASLSSFSSSLSISPPLPPRPPLFPYTTLFRSLPRRSHHLAHSSYRDGRSFTVAGAGLAEVAVGLALAEIHMPVNVAQLQRSEEHTSELQSHLNLVCRLLLEKQKKKKYHEYITT